MSKRVFFRPLTAVSSITSIIVACTGACGGSSSGDGGGSITGTVNGVSFTPQSDVGIVTSGVVGTAGQSVLILLTNRADATCAFAQQSIANENIVLANFDVLELLVADAANDITATTYKVLGTSATVGAMANLLTTDATCNTVVKAAAISGSVTISAISASRIAGSYEVTFAKGSYSGTFNTSFCALPTSTVSDAGTTTCK